MTHAGCRLLTTRFPRVRRRPCARPAGSPGQLTPKTVSGLQDKTWALDDLARIEAPLSSNVWPWEAALAGHRCLSLPDVFDQAHNQPANACDEKSSHARGGQVQAHHGGDRRFNHLSKEFNDLG